MALPLLLTAWSLLVVCNGFDEPRRDPATFVGRLRGEGAKENLQDPNSEVQFVEVKEDEGRGL